MGGLWRKTNSRTAGRQIPIVATGAAGGTINIPDDIDVFYVNWSSSSTDTTSIVSGQVTPGRVIVLYTSIGGTTATYAATASAVKWQLSFTGIAKSIVAQAKISFVQGNGGEWLFFA